MRAVIQLSPTDRPFTAGIAKTKAINVDHQWPEDTLASRGDNAAVEGSSFSYGTVTAPSRRRNFTQLLGALVMKASEKFGYMRETLVMSMVGYIRSDLGVNPKNSWDRDNPQERLLFE